MKTIRKICKIEYALMAYNLVLLLYLLAAIPIEVLTTGKYALLVFLGSAGVSVLAGYTCVRAKVRLSRIHLLAIAFYGWLLVSIGYHAGEIGADNIPHMMLFFCFVFPVFLSFLGYTRAQYLTQWKVIAVGYNLAVSALCAVGIWCTLADRYLSFPAVGYNYIAFVDLKLYILTHYNGVGHFVGFAMLLCLFMLFCANKVWVKVLFALDFALLYVTLGLTYSRTVELTIAACTAIAVCYFIWHAPKLQAAALTAKNILLRIAVCGVVFFAIVAVGYAGMVQVNNTAQAYISVQRAETGSGQKKIEGFAEWFNLSQSTKESTAVSLISLSTAGASVSDGAQPTTTSLVASAHESSSLRVIEAMPGIADSAAQGMTQEEYIAYLQESRSLSDLSTMAARLYYWETALSYFITDAECQIWGTSPAGVVLLLDEILLDADPPHTHNVFVQVIVALGWVGIALFVALWGICLFYAAQAFFTKKHGFAGDCLPLLILLAFTAMGFQENMMFSAETSLMLPAFFMAVASIAHLITTQNKV